MTTKDKKISKEFNEFLSSPEVTPPKALSDAVLLKIHQEMNPSFHKVFMKVLGVHSIVSLFSLSICSQFGIRAIPLYDAMESMMSIVGHTYCMAFCGLLYFSISALVLSLLLKPEEVKVIRQHKLLQLVLLSGVSLGVFLCLGAEVLLLPGVLWVSGSIVGGIVALELGWMLRSRFRKQLIFGN